MRSKFNTILFISFLLFSCSNKNISDRDKIIQSNEIEFNNSSPLDSSLYLSNRTDDCIKANIFTTLSLTKIAADADTRQVIVSTIHKDKNLLKTYPLYFSEECLGDLPLKSFLEIFVEDNTINSFLTKGQEYFNRSEEFSFAIKFRQGIENDEYPLRITVKFRDSKLYKISFYNPLTSSK